MSRDRTAALLAAACLLLPAVPALAGPPVAAAAAAAAAMPADGEVLNVTLDWSGQNSKYVALVNSPEDVDLSEMSEDAQRYYYVGTDAEGVLYVTTRNDGVPQPWLAPSSFEFDYRDTTGAGHHVVVTAVNVPTEPPAPNPDDIPLPVVRDAVTRVDVGALWDGGHPVAGFLSGHGDLAVDVLSYDLVDQGEYTDLYVRAHPLNATMSKYFRLYIPNPVSPGVSQDYLGLAKRKGAPALPARYWDQDWFRLDYTVFGTKGGPFENSPSRDFTFDRTVLFQEPSYRLVATNRVLRYDPHGGYTSMGEASPRPGKAYGLRGGSLRFHLLRVPRTVRSRFEVLLRNPRYATRDSGPRIGVRPRSTRAGRTAKPFKIWYRASAVNRAGDRIYSEPAAYTFRN